MATLKRFLDRFQRRSNGPPGGRLVRRYFVISLLLISGGLLTSGLIEIYYSYNSTLQQLSLLQQEKADATAFRIEQFFASIERGLYTAAKNRVLATNGITPDFRFELARLLRVLPPIMDLAALPLDGSQAVLVSRFKPVLSTQLLDQQDRQIIKRFQSDKDLKRFLGEVEFARQSEPHISLALPIERYPGSLLGVLLADVDLRYVADVVGAVTIGKSGYAYVVSGNGDLIAHPDMSLVLQRKNVGTYVQVKQAIDFTSAGKLRHTLRSINFRGENVFSSFARIPGVNWAVVVEQPAIEINEPIYANVMRTSGLLMLGFGVAVLATIYVTRRVIRPLDLLRKGAQRIGRGDLNYQLEIKTGDELEILADEFNKMSDALRQSYQGLESKIQQRTKEVVALYDISSISTRSLDTDEVMHQVATKISDIFELDNVRIYAYARNEERLQQRAVSGPVDIDLDLIAPFRGKGLVAMVAEGGEAIVFEDIDSDPSYPALTQNSLSRQMGFRFLALVPIKFKGQVRGVIVCNSRESRKLTDQDQRLLASMADQLGPAFGNLTLFEDLRRQSMALEIANGNLNERSRELSALFEVAASATQSLELEPVLQRVAEKIIEMLEFDSARIYLIDDAGATLEMRAIAGQHSDAYKQSFNLGVGIVGAVAKSGEAMIFPDIQSDARYPTVSDDRTLQARGFRFLGIFPIKSKNKFLGTLSCAGMAARLLSAGEIQLTQSLVDHLGPVIENLTLYSRLETANRQLKELDRLKSSFLSNVSHELRTPLTAIGSLADNMLDGVTGSLTDKQSRYITGIKESGERLTRLINDLLDLSVIESGRVKLDPRSFSLSDLVSQVGAGLATVAQEKSVELEVADGTGNHMAWADRDRITQVLTNLIGNAIKFTPQGGKVSVDLGPATDDEWIAINVSDTGPGIPEQERTQIFDEFYQISQPGEKKITGVGLGLAISKKLVEMNGGKISVRSTPGEGSTFTFTVPACREARKRSNSIKERAHDET